jgi:hypothetical protein
MQRFRRLSSEWELYRPCILSHTLEPTARVQRGESSTARCASTGDHQAPSPPERLRGPLLELPHGQILSLEMAWKLIHGSATVGIEWAMDGARYSERSLLDRDL